MNTQRTALVVLVVGILVAGFLGHGLAESGAQQASPPPAWEQQRKEFYLTANTDPADWITVANPRQDEGLSFWITHALIGHETYIALPPEFGDNLTFLKLQPQEATDTHNYRFRQRGIQSLDKPLPLTSTLQILQPTGSPLPIVLVGYYAAPPLIEVLEIEGG